MNLGAITQTEDSRPAWRRAFRFHPITLRKQFFQVPNVICYPSFHGRSNAERLMGPAEVVVGEVQAVSTPQVVPLFAEGIG